MEELEYLPSYQSMLLFREKMKKCEYAEDYSKCPNIKEHLAHYLDKKGKCICHRLAYLGDDKEGDSICDGECFSYNK